MVLKNMTKRTRLDQLLVEGGFFENIEKEFSFKIRGFKKYKSEIEKFPNPVGKTLETWKRKNKLSINIIKFLSIFII